MNNRTKAVYWNTITVMGCHLLQIVLSFVVRKVFISTLGVYYLGYNSVFSNILQLLNLADLGIGVAITSFLYKPLADNDRPRLTALMYLYKRIYRVMGAVILIIGIVISVFLGYLIPDLKVDLWYLRFLFYLNLIATVSTYYLAYKRTLIIADQKSYIANITDTASFFAVSVAQIVCLFVAPNYVVFLLLALAKNIVSNIIISIKCNSLFGNITENPDQTIVSEYKPQIMRYVKDVFISRIGSVVFYGTDSIIISTLKGSLLAGLLSNYTMITGYLTTIVTQLLASIQATFGNYISSDKSISEQKKMTDNYLLANYLIGNFCMICFIFIVQPFINLYLGQQLLLGFSTAVWLGVNLMLSLLMQLPSQVFTIYKLFRYDRPIIIVSAILNIIISVVLVKYIGIDGALIGTFVTSLIYLFSRFFIISKEVYHVTYISYIKRILAFFLISTFTFCIAFFTCNDIDSSTWKSFVVRCIFVGLTAAFLPCACLSFTVEFKFLASKLLPKKVRKYANPAVFGGAAALVIVASIIVGGG